MVRNCSPTKALIPTAALFLSVVAACSSPQQPAPTNPTPAPAATVTVTAPAATPSVSPVDSTLCDLLQRDALIVSDAFASVKASRGKPDHAKLVEAFADYAKDLADDSKDDCGPGDRSVAAAKLSMEAALLNVQVVAAGEADDYGAAAKAGQEMFDVFGVTDTRFGKSLI